MSKASLKAIREYCLECAGSYKEVQLCKPIAQECPLWKYRLGVDPDRKEYIPTEAQLKNLKRFEKISAE